MSGFNPHLMNLTSTGLTTHHQPSFKALAPVEESAGQDPPNATEAVHRCGVHRVIDFQLLKEQGGALEPGSGKGDILKAEVPPGKKKLLTMDYHGSMIKIGMICFALRGKATKLRCVSA